MVCPTCYRDPNPSPGLSEGPDHGRKVDRRKGSPRPAGSAPNEAHTDRTGTRGKDTLGTPTDRSQHARHRQLANGSTQYRKEVTPHMHTPARHTPSMATPGGRLHRPRHSANPPHRHNPTQPHWAVGPARLPPGPAAPTAPESPPPPLCPRGTPVPAPVPRPDLRHRIVAAACSPSKPARPRPATSGKRPPLRR